MNCLFGLKTKISLGDRTLIATATATACFLTALPVPKRPRLMTNSAWQNDPQYLSRTQKKLEEKIAENEKYYGLHHIKGVREEEEEEVTGAAPNHEEEGDDGEDFSAGNKDMCVLEVWP